jgi:hypothetical protein
MSKLQEGFSPVAGWVMQAITPPIRGLRQTLDP